MKNKEKKIFDVTIKSAINLPNDSKGCYIKVTTLLGNNRFQTIKQTTKCDSIYDKKDKCVVAEWNKTMRIVTSLATKTKGYQSKIVLFSLKTVKKKIS